MIKVGCFMHNNHFDRLVGLPDDISNIDAGIKEESSLSGHAVSIGEVTSHTHVDGRARWDNGHNMGNLRKGGGKGRRERERERTFT